MKKKTIKHNSIYRGSLMTFQHYLNCYHSLLPIEERLANTKEYLYEIKEEYENAILVKIVIERKELKNSKSIKEETTMSEPMSQEEIPDEIFEKALGILNHLDFETKTLQEKVDYLVEVLLSTIPAEKPAQSNVKSAEIDEGKLRKLIARKASAIVDPIFPYDDESAQSFLRRFLQEYDQLRRK